MRRIVRNCGALKNMPAVLCDFDDTVAVQNVAELLLEHFGDSRWQTLRQKFRERTITLKEYQERAFADLAAGRDAMKAQVKEKATLRPYFKELWHHCQKEGFPLAIVTHGLDFYVEALLEKEGLEAVPRYAVKALFTSEGVNYDYLYTRDDCSLWGNCKCAVLEGYREKGHSIVYVGDGRSDFCPASRADLVFARSHLAQYCKTIGVTHMEFNDFRDVVRTLEAAQRIGGI